MHRRTFLKGLLGLALLPFLPKASAGLVWHRAVEQETHVAGSIPVASSSDETVRQLAEMVEDADLSRLIDPVKFQEAWEKAYGFKSRRFMTAGQGWHFSHDTGRLTVHADSTVERLCFTNVNQIVMGERAVLNDCLVFARYNWEPLDYEMLVLNDARVDGCTFTGRPPAPQFVGACGRLLPSHIQVGNRA